MFSFFICVVLSSFIRVVISAFFASPASEFSKYKRRQKQTQLSLARTLCITADNLDAVGVDLVRVVELEVDVLDNEGPDVVTEAVGIEVALHSTGQYSLLLAASCKLQPSSYNVSLNVP